MKQLLEYLITNISGVNTFKINEETDQDVIKFSVTLPKDKMGLIIGKEGKVIRAIRNIMRVRATLEKKLVNIEIIEEA